MAHFRFLLTNPNIELKTSFKEESDNWLVSFDVTIQPPYKDELLGSPTFTVVSEVGKFNGYTLTGRLDIDPHPSKYRTQENGFKPPWQKVGYIAIQEGLKSDGLVVLPPIFLIATSLLPDAFFRILQVNPENYRIELRITVPTLSTDTCTNLKEVGGLYEAPYGGLINMMWDTTKGVRMATLTEVHLTITPRAPTNAVSESESRPPAPPVPPSRDVDTLQLIADTSKLLSVVNRLFWAVVIIGLLLVLKVS